MTKVLIVAIAALLLASCATQYYRYNGKQYQSEPAAIEAVRTDIRGKVIAIPKMAHPLANSALVFVPSLEWCRQTVVTHGNPSNDDITYIQTAEYYGFYGMAQALQQRGVFNTLTINEFSQREPYAQPNYQYIIWLKLNGTSSATWMIAPGTNPDAAQQLAISPIDSASDRISDFVHSVEQYLREHPNKLPRD